ncbi:MAG: iron ABC transporter permease [Candidatus Heimdallarchaeota archaeon]|nr:iron ABC transporter permease [Candidatus Heimdallarchaeota archaeon]
MLSTSLKRKARIDSGLNKSIIILVVLAFGSFLILFFYAPLSKIFQYAFSEGNQVTFDYFISTITNPLNLKFLMFTFVQALLSMIICLILGIPASYFFAKYNFKGKNLLLNLMTIPFVLPAIVVLLGFIVTYGESGWFNSIWYSLTGSHTPLIQIFGTFEGILIAHVFYNLSVIIRMTIPAWKSIDSQQINVAKSLGASNLRIFTKIIIPQIINYIISASLLVFIYTFNSFAIVLYLGEIKFQTLEVRIYKLMKASLDFNGGATLALIQLFLNTIIIVLYLLFESKTRQMAEGKESIFQGEKIIFTKSNWRKNLKLLAIIMFIVSLVIFTFSPIIAIIIESFQPYTEGVSPFWGYQQLFSNDYLPLLNNSPLRMLLNTLLFATLTTIITLILSVLLVFVLRNRYQSLKKYKKSPIENFVSYIIILPMATSSITLAIGMFLFFNSTAIYRNLVWIFIVLSHVLISIPFATRSILSSYNRIDIEMLNVASTLGASRLRIFRKIELPHIYRGIIVGGIFSFAISLGEFGATNFLVRGEYGTLSIGISKLIETQTLQLPATMASILVIITVICFLVIQKLGEIELKV